MIKILILSVLLTGLAFLALGLRIFFVSKGKFPETSIGKNREMKKLGITCASEDGFSCGRNPEERTGCGCHTNLS